MKKHVRLFFVQKCVTCACHSSECELFILISCFKISSTCFCTSSVCGVQDAGKPKVHQRTMQTAKQRSSARCVTKNSRLQPPQNLLCTARKRFVNLFILSVWDVSIYLRQCRQQNNTIRKCVWVNVFAIPVTAIGLRKRCLLNIDKVCTNSISVHVVQNFGDKANSSCTRRSVLCSLLLGHLFLVNIWKLFCIVFKCHLIMTAMYCLIMLLIMICKYMSFAS